MSSGKGAEIIFLLALQALCYKAQRAYCRKSSHGKPTPHGVRSMKVRRTSSFCSFRAHAAAVGPVISFRVYNRRIVVLNSPEAVEALLEKRQDIYSERPMSWMYNVICARGKSVFNIDSSNSRHRQYRRLIQTGLGARSTRSYIPLVQTESMKLAEALLHKPSDLIRHAQRYALHLAHPRPKIYRSYIFKIETPSRSFSE